MRQKYNRKNHYQILFIVILLYIAYAYSDSLVDYFYRKTFSGCRPTFYHPFWDYARAILGSVIAILALFIVKLNRNMMNIFIALNLWLILNAFIYLHMIGRLHIFELLSLFCYYAKKEMLLVSANILCGVYLLNHSKIE